MDLVLGVDGGNTKTVALVADLGGRVLGRARAGSSNMESLGAAGAAAVIAACVEAALLAAGAAPGEITAAHLGLAGVDWPEDAPALRRELFGLPWANEAAIENDAFLGMRACAPGGIGIGVTAGSGVCACIIPEKGEPYFYGGFTDIGGGFDIDQRTLQAVVRAEDGRGPATALTDPILAASGRPSVYRLVQAVCREGLRLPSTVIRPILFAAARQGDPAACEIVQSFGRELALCAVNLIRRHGLAGGEPRVVAAGSLFTRTGPLLFETFRREVLAAAPRAHVSCSQHPPVLGAVRAALRALGRDSEDVWREVCRTAPGDEWFKTAEDVERG